MKKIKCAREECVTVFLLITLVLQYIKIHI